MRNREERLNYAEALLDAALAKHGPVKLSGFIEALTETRHLGVKHITAVSYWEGIKHLYNWDGVTIKNKVKKP
jgi:hypothetical protein